MQKEFKTSIIVFILAVFLGVLAPVLYSGPTGIDGIGSALVFVLFIRFIGAVLIVSSIILVVIGVAKQNNWSKKRTIIAATIPIVLLIGIIVIPIATDKLERKIYLETHHVEDLFSARITNVSWIESQENNETYLVLEYELTNIKANYFEKFDYKLGEMFHPYMNEADCQPYFVAQNGIELNEPYYEYIRDNIELYPNYLHTDVHSGSNKKHTLKPGESKIYCTIFKLDDETTPIDINFVFSNGYSGGVGVVYSETITPP